MDGPRQEKNWAGSRSLSGRTILGALRTGGAVGRWVLNSYLVPGYHIVILYIYIYNITIWYLGTK